jgi:hypothetical protein
LFLRDSERSIVRSCYLSAAGDRTLARGIISFWKELNLLKALIPWSSPLRKLIVAQKFKKISIFYETSGFVTVFT